MKRPFSKTMGVLVVVAMILTGNLAGFKALATGDEDPVKTTESANPPDGVWIGYEVTTERYVSDVRIEHFGFIGGEFSRIVNVYDYRKCCILTGKDYVGCSAGVKCNN